MFFPGYNGGGAFGGPGGGFPFAGPGGQQRFEQSYRVYPVSFIDKPHLESGDKIIMPPSALDRLASLHIDYPMLFEVTNPAEGNKSHCGVLEFIADEGAVYMPYWMMQNLLLSEGDLVRLKSATLPKGTYVKLQPHTSDFLDISNPKAVLETTLRSFSCLTTGDNIMMAYNNRKYYINIVEAKPGPAISIIETDCEVDFAPPLDYKEPERVPRAPPVVEPKASAPKAEPEPAPEEPKFMPFTGGGRRLDGKPPKTSPSASTGAAAAAAARAGATSAPPRTSSEGAPAAAPAEAPRRASGKLVFGAGGGSAGPKVPTADKEKAPEKPKEPEEKKSSFAAFTGKGYSLKG